MNRETEAHFSHLPTLNIKRSKFNRPITHKTTFNTGEIIPLYVDSDIMPGDSIRINMGAVLRESTPIAPVMDNLYIDVMAFFCPHRLVMTHYPEYWGENPLTPWESEIKYEKPKVYAPETGWEKGSLADYFGIPTEVPGYDEKDRPHGLWVNALPGRAYCKIYDDWFRSTALQDGVLFNLDETNLLGKNGTDNDYDKVTDTQLLAKPLKAGKYHDRFTSATPEPQYGDPVELEIVADSKARVYAGTTTEAFEIPNDSRISYRYIDAITGEPTTPTNNTDLGARNTGESIYWDSTHQGTNIKGYFAPNNLYADLGIINSAITINALRQAIALQEYSEALARGGWAKR